jgi:ribonuclease HI
MPKFTCGECGAAFALPPTVLDRYPGWQPSRCLACRNLPKTAGGGSGKPRHLPDDPLTGVFTDGGASPNPGPGGWGAVYVIDDVLIAEEFGHDEATTNNRMELTALLAALRIAPSGVTTVVYSDSNLAVRTVNEWATGWEQRGWKRKTGPVENLDLVKAVYEGFRERPELELKWIKAHAGFKWNEYADELANRWREDS